MALANVLRSRIFKIFQTITFQLIGSVVFLQNPLTYLDNSIFWMWNLFYFWSEKALLICCLHYYRCFVSFWQNKRMLKKLTQCMICSIPSPTRPPNFFPTSIFTDFPDSRDCPEPKLLKLNYWNLNSGWQTELLNILKWRCEPREKIKTSSWRKKRDERNMINEKKK